MTKNKALIRDGAVVPLKIVAVEEFAREREVATLEGFEQKVVNVYIVTVRVVGAPLEAYIPKKEDGEQPEFKVYGWAQGGKWGDRPLSKETLPPGAQFVDWLPHDKESGDTMDRLLSLGGYWDALDRGNVLFPLDGVVYGQIAFHVNPNDPSRFANYLHKHRGERGAVTGIALGGKELLTPPVPTSLGGLRRRPQEGEATQAPAAEAPKRGARPTK